MERNTGQKKVSLALGFEPASLLQLPSEDNVIWNKPIITAATGWVIVNNSET